MSLNLKVTVINNLFGKRACLSVCSKTSYCCNIIYHAVCDIICVITILALIFEARIIVRCHTEGLLLAVSNIAVLSVQNTAFWFLVAWTCVSIIRPTIRASIKSVKVLSATLAISSEAETRKRIVAIHWVLCYTIICWI